MKTTYGTLIRLLVLLVIFAGCGPKSDTQIFEDYKAKAEKGNVEAQSCLGVCYYHSKGVAMDRAKVAEAH